MMFAYCRDQFYSSKDGHTVCGDSTHDGNVQHYTMHNSYGVDQLRETVAQEVPGVDFHFTKHSIPGVATMGGVVLSDVEPSWDNLRRTLKEAIELGLAGVPMVSMSGCGVYTYETPAALYKKAS